MYKPFEGYNKKEIIQTKGKSLTVEQKKAIYDRNAEIAELKRQGRTWGEIARKFDLSREYVKTIGHKLGAYGDKRGLL